MDNVDSEKIVWDYKKRIKPEIGESRLSDKLCSILEEILADFEPSTGGESPTLPAKNAKSDVVHFGDIHVYHQLGKYFIGDITNIETYLLGQSSEQDNIPMGLLGSNRWIALKYLLEHQGQEVTIDEISKQTGWGNETSVTRQSQTYCNLTNLMQKINHHSKYWTILKFKSSDADITPRTNTQRTIYKLVKTPELTAR